VSANFSLFIISSGDGGSNECRTEVMMVLDESGSMTTYIDKVKNTSKDFIDKYMGGSITGNRAGVVWYESNARLAQGLTTSKEDVKTAIDTGSGGGGTKIDKGILKAVDEFNDNGDPSIPDVIVLLTDGQDLT